MLDWSPEQISGWLKQSYPDNESLRVSHETIYRTLFLQARGALKQELVRHLRSRRRIRLRGTPAFTGTRKARSPMRFPSASDLRKSKIVPFRVIGRSDLLRGTRNSHNPTLVERHSRFCMLVKVPGKDTATVVTALSQHVRQLPETLRRSCDLGPNGLEVSPARELHDGYRYAGLLLRSQKSANSPRHGLRTDYCVIPAERRQISVHFDITVGLIDQTARLNPATTWPWDFKLSIHCNSVASGPARPPLFGRIVIPYGLRFFAL